MSATNFVFGEKLYVLNTFIGGIAKTGGTGVNAPINTVSLLASRLLILENRIKNFSITGDDVSCHIIGNYDIPDRCFGHQTSSLANKNITYYYDDGLKVNILRNYSFANTTLANSRFNAANNIRDFAFSGCLQKVFVMPGVTTSFNGWKGHNLLESLTLNSFSVNTEGTFRDCINPLLQVNLPSLVNAGVLLFSGLSTFNTLSGVPNLRTLSNLSFHNCYGFLTLTLQVTSVSSSCFYGMYNCESYFLNDLTTINGNNTWLIGSRKLKLVEIKKCKTITGSTDLFAQNAGFPVPHPSDFKVRINKAVEANVAITNIKVQFPYAVIEVFDDNGIYLYNI